MGGMTFHVVAVKAGAKAVLVMKRKGRVSTLSTPFTTWRPFASDTSGEMNARDAAAAVKWVKKKGWKPILSRDPYPFVVRQSKDVHWPKDATLLRKLNGLGRRRKHLVMLVSGYRTDYEQWELRMKFLAGNGNLAARCCMKYWPDVIHSWDNCGKDSQSNHSKEGNGRGAADCGLITAGGYVSLGNVPGIERDMRDLELCLPVRNPYEPWHAQVGPWVG